ncbi:MAG: hypothetical protein Q8O87_04220 [bacterium]|nr:hypothetical protein [bacterium]
MRAIYYCKEYLIFHKRLYPKKIHYKIELEERAHEVKNLKDIEYLPFTIRNGNLEELPEEVVYKKKSWWKKNSK